MSRYITQPQTTFNRSTVGFDRLFGELEQHLLNTQSDNYPPYNIVEINENEWMITVAVAGFGMDNLDIVQERRMLKIFGSQYETDGVKYLHKGIGGRKFTREFTLAEYIEVEGATLDLGMLNVHLIRRVPEQMKAKKIEIKEPASLALGEVLIDKPA